MAVLTLSPLTNAAKLKRDTDIIVEVAGTIHVAKPSLDVIFKKHTNNEMKADMNWEIYWTLKRGLQIEYACTNADITKDMCSNIRIEIEDDHNKVELSTANPTVVLDKRSRFKKDKFDTVAYLNLNGLSGGEIKATGHLILSAVI